MSPMLLSGIFGVAKEVITRLFPDPAEKAKALQKLTEMENEKDLAWLNANVAIATGQIETNKIEAEHGGIFKGGWRPFIGWICGFALAYKFILYPFFVFTVQAIAHFMPDVDPLPIEIIPVIEWAELSVILLGMLGLGGMRSYEKQKTAGR